MRRIRGLVSCAVVAVWAVVMGSGVNAVAQGSEQPSGDSTERTRGGLVMVLDSSGSMDEPAAGGESKIEAAKSALTTVVDNLPEHAVVGMRVFGATVFERGDPGACEDSQLVVPVGPADKGALRAAIAEYEPYGETPISYALREAAKDLGDQGQRTILLVSDGESTCQPDPCVVAAELAAQGIELRIDVVGLDVDGAARDQLTCIAEQGNGTYYDAASADELASSMDTIATRAMEPFEVTGTPVEGTPDFRSAPTLEPGGQYTDTLPAKGEQKHYGVTRTTPGSTIIVGITGKPERDINNSGLGLRLAADGEACGRTQADVSGGNKAAYLILGGSVSTLNDLTTDETCETAEELDLIVEQASGDDLEGTAVQFKVWEIGPVDGFDQLPPASYEELSWTQLSPDRHDPTDVTGGTSFDTATAIEPGTYADNVVPGETRVYRISVEWGQRLQAQVNVDPMSDKMRDVLERTTRIGVRIYGPTGADATSSFTSDESNQSLLVSPSGAVAQAMTSTVRYRNLEHYHDFVNAAALDGDYYVGVTVPADPDGDTPEIPFTLTVGLEGTAGEGAPDFEAITSPTGEPADGGEETSSPDSEPGQTADSAPAGSGEPGPPAASDDTEPASAITPERATLGIAGITLLLAGGVFVYRWMRTTSS